MEDLEYFRSFQQCSVPAGTTVNDRILNLLHQHGGWESLTMGGNQLDKSQGQFRLLAHVIPFALEKSSTPLSTFGQVKHLLSYT